MSPFLALACDAKSPLNADQKNTKKRPIRHDSEMRTAGQHEIQLHDWLRLRPR